MVTNIWRHYQQVHHSELLVKNILALAKDNSRRDREITRLRQLGDYYHNLNVLCVKRGKLVVVRRPRSMDVDYTDFLPCTACKGFFLRKELWRHVKSCQFVEAHQDDEHVRCQKDASLLIAPVMFSSANASHALSQVLVTMKRDDISLVAKNDILILSFGEFLAHGQASTKFVQVSQRMRQLARLVIQLREASEKPDADLQAFLKPECFDMVVESVLLVAKYAESTGTEVAKMNIPSLALKIGHSVRKCCNLLVNKALREKDEIKESDAQSFVRLFDSEWQYRVSCIALRSMKNVKRNKPDLIPITGDLMKLKTYLDESVKQCCEALNAVPDKANYMSLIDVTLSRIILFNKRRGGEAARMLVASYHQSGLSQKSGLDDIEDTLSKTEKQLCSRLKLVEIEGKRNRTVPVLLTLDVAKAIDCILANREKVGVDKNNVYVFARSAGLNSVDACDCMRRVTESAGVERPELIRSTKLRKYVATVSQLLDMTENELDLLCNHMGHSINVHHNFYRLPSQTLELAKISKLLLAVETGKLKDLSGKKFEELDIEDIADIDEDEEKSDNELTEDQESSDLTDSTQPDSHEVLMECGSSCVKHRSKKLEKSVNMKTGYHVKESARSLQKKSKNELDVSEHQESSDVTNSQQCDSNEDLVECGNSSVKDRSLLKKVENVNIGYHRKDTMRSVQKRPWSADEKDAVFQHLNEYIRNGVVPGKKPCVEAIEKSGGILRNRKWQHVKYAVKNILDSNKSLLK